MASTLKPDQTRLFKRCPQWAIFRPGSVRCEGYRHAIGANNGLMALVRLGYVTRGISQNGGNLFQMTQAGRDARADLDKVQT